MDGKGVDVLFSRCHRDDKLNVPRPSIFGAQTLEMFSGGFDDDVIFCCCHHDEELKKVPRPCIYGAQTLEMFSGGRNERARKHSALGVSKFSSVQLFQQLQMYKRAGVQLYKPSSFQVCRRVNNCKCTNVRVDNFRKCWAMHLCWSVTNTHLSGLGVIH